MVSTPGNLKQAKSEGALLPNPFKERRLKNFGITHFKYAEKVSAGEGDSAVLTLNHLPPLASEIVCERVEPMLSGFRLKESWDFMIFADADVLFTSSVISALDGMETHLKLIMLSHADVWAIRLADMSA
ncbi:hypothetical protein GCM10008957_33000 [Deinococcus ruber]|uniref:Uncharacterized protein n=1 Tax=Deinococcus ruber TaxID=1848197 RepID=A0A918CEV8_9DEIO|nr:hypothetical protein [Deinococcus ruber]GGR17692.1 hypothetical protein GCM10008957_33000 [Deinococcus ruber]